MSRPDNHALRASLLRRAARLAVMAKEHHAIGDELMTAAGRLVDEIKALDQDGPQPARSSPRACRR